MQDSADVPQPSPAEDDGWQPVATYAGMSPSEIQLPMWPMLRADVSAAARCLVPLLIANCCRVHEAQAPTFTSSVASTLIGADDMAAIAELMKIGFLTKSGTTYVLQTAPPANYRGPRNLAEACALYRGTDHDER